MIEESLNFDHSNSEAHVFPTIIEGTTILPILQTWKQFLVVSFAAVASPVSATCRWCSSHKHIYYLDKYFDEHYEYRHLMLPKELSKQVPKTHLMYEEEWRSLCVQQSLGWVHYMVHEPEPHILLFRRPLPKEQQK
ncbi:cyclin-dependent kinases regulatory subunit 2-like [Dromiciops gliroides]|uniref:cyclin-dependent kinases regulatory subunit 2-like n=1 Tax=Dromiciops gliroides TaxID=33562 RepID=UPI001CC35248|nr:cyclin-dependent kinases regulatory subunit 2-like [Dromiciops gliroides]